VLSDHGDLPPADAQVNRIYLTRDLVGAAVRYVQKDTRGGGQRALMLTLDAAVAASSGC
jgi:hypothetical protein